MSKKKLTKFQKGLIKEAHGGKRINKDFWYGQLEPEEEETIPTPKDNFKKSMRFLPVLLLIPIIYLAIHGKTLYEEYQNDNLGNIQFVSYFKDYFGLSEPDPQPQVSIQPIRKDVTSKTPTKNKQPNIPLLPSNTMMFIVTDKLNNRYFTSNNSYVPETGYTTLEFEKVQSNKTYCWKEGQNQMCSKGAIPLSSKRQLLRLLSIK